MASAATKSRRTRRYRDPEDVRIARLILPEGQARRDTFEAVDISNHSEDDQRIMVRSGERRTIRRKHKIDELVTRGVINNREAKACEWYYNTHEELYEAKVRIADWGAIGGSSDRAYGHWPHGAILEPGMNMLEYARQAINPVFLPMFERVVLHGRPLGKLAITFRTSARQLLERIEGMVQL